MSILGMYANTNAGRLISPSFIYLFNLPKFMLYEDAMDMYMLYSISPELTCTCDEFHMCQQCCEEDSQSEE